MKTSKGSKVEGGRTYGQVTPGGPLLPAQDGLAPDLWICRRVADFPGQQVPIGGATAACGTCGALIVFNPARPVQAPKVCMQCAHIQPDPL